MEDIKSIVKEIKRVKSDVKHSNNYIQYSEYIAEQIDKTIIIGGGDTSTLVDKNSNIYVSTGGGALLEFLENVSKNNGYLSGINIFTIS